MPTDTNEIAVIIQHLLKNLSARKSSLTGLEILVIDSIVKKETYRKASIRHQYTESSFQNAASKLFKELSLVIGKPVNRRNFVEVVKNEWATSQAPVVQDSPMIFDRLQADFWVREDRAQLVSIGYESTQALDLTEYLVRYSPKFGATFCLEVGDQTSPLDLLGDLCRGLQITLPTPHDDEQVLLKMIGGVLKKRSTLLVIRFERSLLGMDQSLQGQYANILVEIGMLKNTSCLLVLESKADLHHSLNYLLRSKIESIPMQSAKMAETRLVSINNDRSVIRTLLETYSQ
jgi:hypothetical protein